MSQFATNNNVNVHMIQITNLRNNIENCLIVMAARGTIIDPAIMRLANMNVDIDSLEHTLSRLHLMINNM